MRALRALGLVCVAGWLGMMAFVGLTGVPLMVRAMDRGTAGQVVLAVLPSHYAWGGALCVAALVACVRRSPGPSAAAAFLGLEIFTLPSRRGR